MTAGQAHGPGIYLARNAITSAGYCSVSPSSRGGPPPSPAPMEREVTGLRTHDPDTLVMLAICEVANVPSLRMSGSIWVCPEEAAVVTRFFLVYRGQGVPSVDLNSKQLSAQLAALTRRTQE